MTLSPQWLDELRARTTLSAVIAPSVKLIKAGREFKACCPFHNEKTPSFTVNDLQKSLTFFETLGFAVEEKWEDGGKLLGAGKGGFMMFLAPPDVQMRISRSLPDLKPVTFRFDRTGAQIVFYQPVDLP